MKSAATRRLEALGGFSPIERKRERALHKECGYKKAWSPRGSFPIGREEERAL
jgi:hypothetical protein